MKKYHKEGYKLVQCGLSTALVMQWSPQILFFPPLLITTLADSDLLNTQLLLYLDVPYSFFIWSWVTVKPVY